MSASTSVVTAGARINKLIVACFRVVLVLLDGTEILFESLSVRVVESIVQK